MTTLLSSTALRNTCSGYLKAHAIAIAMNIFSGFVISLINIVIKQFFSALAAFQRYPTVSKEAASTVFNYFLSMYINTAIIPILTNGNIFGFQLSKEIVSWLVKDKTKM